MVDSDVEEDAMTKVTYTNMSSLKADANADQVDDEILDKEKVYSEGLNKLDEDTEVKAKLSELDDDIVREEFDVSEMVNLPYLLYGPELKRQICAVEERCLAPYHCWSTITP